MARRYIVTLELTTDVEDMVEEDGTHEISGCIRALDGISHRFPEFDIWGILHPTEVKAADNCTGDELHAAVEAAKKEHAFRLLEF